MNKSIELPMTELSPLLLDSLSRGQEAVLPVTGVSMTPFLRPERDAAVLKQADPSALQVGDVALYRRDNGQYVLHRVWRRVEHPSLTYTMLGDAQWIGETGIRPQQILAVATAFVRGEERVPVSDPAYRRRVAAWQRLLPLRRILLAVWRRLDRR